MRSVLSVHWKDWCWNSSTLATWCEKLTHLKKPWCWERLRAGEGDDRGWDGWMASPAQQTWVWVDSGSWWWIGRPGVLRFMGSQRVTNNWVIELNWTEPVIMSYVILVIFQLFSPTLFHRCEINYIQREYWQEWSFWVENQLITWSWTNPKPIWILYTSSVKESTQFSSVAQLCPTESTQTHVHQVGDVIQPSHPLSPPSPSAPNPSHN